LWAIATSKLGIARDDVEARCTYSTRRTPYPVILACQLDEEGVVLAPFVFRQGLANGSAFQCDGKVAAESAVTGLVLRARIPWKDLGINAGCDGEAVRGNDWLTLMPYITAIQAQVRLACWTTGLDAGTTFLIFVDRYERGALSG
jgi:hypothetical protein